MYSGIYIIQNSVTGKLYVGSSKHIQKRLIQHINSLNQGRHHNYLLQNSFDKYGSENFVFSVLDIVPEDELKVFEQYAIDEMSAAGIAYNLSKTASGGDLLTYHPNRDEIIAKMTKTIQDRCSAMTAAEKKERFGSAGQANNMFGRTHTQEAKQRISAANTGNQYAKGATRSNAFRERLSEIASTRTGAKNPFFGRVHTEETRSILREQRLGIPSTNCRQVSIDGVIYPSCTEAARRLGVCTATILHRIKSQNTLYQGYIYL